MNRKVIYLDMDGVLADFDTYYYRNGRKSFVYEDFQREVMENHLFENLPLMPGYEELIGNVYRLADEYDYDVEVCSSVHTYIPEMFDAAERQKRYWLKDVACLKTTPANFVERKSQKANFANPKAILIDDSIECINYFREAGGKAICHKDVATTLSLLEGMMKIESEFEYYV